jgi:hypothetical protein
MGGAFYEPIGKGKYRPSAHTAGPWSTDSQHLGPPTALLVREFEQCEPRADMALTRLTVEVLGPVPVTDLDVVASVERPGRSVELLRGALLANGREVAVARAWRMTTTDTTTVVTGAPPALKPPMQATAMPIPDGWSRGYVDALEWRTLRGGMFQPGGATVWARLRVDVVAGEEPSGLQRLLAVADSASGVSSKLDIRHWLFINTDLSVHLYRQPRGEWVGLDADTVIGPTGAGVATSVLHDQDGAVGRTTQSLLVRPRMPTSS